MLSSARWYDGSPPNTLVATNAAAAAAQSAMPAGEELADGVVVGVPLPDGVPVGEPLAVGVPVIDGVPLVDGVLEPVSGGAD